MPTENMQPVPPQQLESEGEMLMRAEPVVDDDVHDWDHFEDHEEEQEDIEAELDDLENWEGPDA